MITIISGTNRKNSYSLKMAKAVAEILHEKNISNQILSLEELNPNFVSTKINDEADIEFDKIVEEKINSADKFIFVIAEYHGSYPGILKVFLDAVPSKYFKSKKSALIGIASGRGAALRPLDQLTGVLHYLQVEVLSDKPKFSDIENCFDTNDNLIDEAGKKRVEGMIEKLLHF